jgi:hypothetical protein
MRIAPAPAAASPRPGQPAPSGRATAATVTAYAAAFAYALVSACWALSGHALISTVGGYLTQLAHRGEAAAVLLALGAAAAAKAAGGLLALALVRPWGGSSRAGGCGPGGLRHWVSYSSWRRHQIPVSLRPRGARSSHAYIPHSTSIPRS